MESIFLLASSFPVHPICRLEALSVPGLCDAIGLFTEQELVETVTARLIAVVLILLKSCYLLSVIGILFAIVLVQLVKLKSERSTESWNGWCLTSKEDLFHSLHVKFSFVNFYASWCLVSTYLIWILGSRLIFSNNQWRATLWVRDTCLIVGLLLFDITASLSSTTYNIALGENFAFDGTESNIFQMKIVVLGWNFCVVSRAHIWWGVMQQVSREIPHISCHDHKMSSSLPIRAR